MYGRAFEPIFIAVLTVVGALAGFGVGCFIALGAWG